MSPNVGYGGVLWCSDGETDVHGSDGHAGPDPHQLLLLHSGCFHALRGQTGELLFRLSLCLCSTNVIMLTLMNTVQTRKQIRKHTALLALPFFLSHVQKHTHMLHTHTSTHLLKVLQPYFPLARASKAKVCVDFIIWSGIKVTLEPACAGWLSWQE